MGASSVWGDTGESRKTTSKCESLAQGFAERRKSSSSRLLQQVTQSDDKCPEREAYKGERIGSKDGPSEAADARKQTTGEKRRKAASSGTGAGRREESVCGFGGWRGGGGGGGGVVVVELFAAHQIFFFCTGPTFFVCRVR